MALVLQAVLGLPQIPIISCIFKEVPNSELIPKKFPNVPRDHSEEEWSELLYIFKHYGRHAMNLKS